MELASLSFCGQFSVGPIRPALRTCYRQLLTEGQLKTVDGPHPHGAAGQYGSRTV